VNFFGLEHGLSHREVFSIHQDKRGFIWLATKYGLNRFDGNAFKWWTKEKNGLTNNEMHHILEDASSFLWVFTMDNWYNSSLPSHLSLIDINTGKAYTLEERFGTSIPFQITDIVSFKANKEGVLFFTTKKNKLYTFTPQGLFKETTLPLKGIFQLEHVAPNGHLWASVGPTVDRVRHLVEFKPDGTIVRSFDLKQSKFWLEVLSMKGNDSLYYATFHEDHPPEIYTITQNGRQQIYQHPSLEKELAAIYPFWDKKIFHQADSDHFWFKGDTLLHIVHPEKGKIFDLDNEEPQIGQANVHSVFFDQQGITWLGTASGLFQVDLHPNQFTRYLYEKDFPVAENYSCRGIWADNKQLIVNTYKGRMMLHREDHSSLPLPYIPHLKNNGSETLLGFFPLALQGNKHGDIWFGESSLIHRNIHNEQEQVFSWDKSLTNEYNIWSIHQSNSGKIWLGTEHGLGYLDTISQSLQLDSIANNYGELGQSHIYAFVKSAKGHVWLATTSGLYSWKENQGILNRWWPGAEGGNHIPHEHINHVHEDQEGILWLASGGGGLIRLDTRPAQKNELKNNPPLYQQFTVADGLSNNNLYGVYEDEQQRLWISSDFGIIQFDKTTFSAKAFLPKDGVTHREFNRISHYQAADGSLSFGSLNGVTAFHPNQFSTTINAYAPPLQIVDFQQFDNKTDQLIDRTSQLQKTKTITLRAGDRLFRIAFSLLDYRHQEQIRYAWKLEGLDKEWNYIRENFIRVSGLAPGNYTLKIKGQATDGQWSNKELHLNVIVLRPFYESNWFWSLNMLLLLTAIFGFYKWRTHQLKTRQLKLEQLVKQRTRTIEEQREKLLELDKLKNNFFTNISHELRTPLSLMLGPINSALKRSDLNHKTHNYLKLAQQSGYKLLQFVNEILDLSKMDADKLQLKEENTLLLPFMHRLLSQFESQAHQKEIDLSFVYEAGPQLQIILDPHKFEIIFNNLLFNALKFTSKGGQVMVKLNDKGKVLLLEVRDTGPGIHPQDLPHIFDRFYQSKYGASSIQSGTGIGLALCKEYALLFGGTIMAKNAPDKGTVLLFEFPKKEVNTLVSTSTFISPPGMAQKDIVKEHEFSSMSEQGLKILLVEDNLGLQTYIQLLLREKYQITTVGNGQAALDWLAKKEQVEQKPALIISDVMMPVMDGIQLLQKLKAADCWRHIPVILLTARAGMPDKLKAFRIGVDDYILKPFEEEELIARIENVLKNHQTRNIAVEEEAVLKEDNKVILSEADAIWLSEQEQLLKKEFINPNFTATQWAAQVALSERHLQRKLKLLTGMSPYKYLSEIRLTEARQMLETGTHHTIAEVAYSVGFSNPQSFTRSFRKRFGKVPSDYF